MTQAPTMGQLADYLLVLYNNPTSHPEAIIEDVWRLDPYALETILWAWHPQGASSWDPRRGAVPWFAAQFMAALNGDRDEEYAHDLFTAFVRTDGLEHMKEAMRMLAGETLKQRNTA